LISIYLGGGLFLTKKKGIHYKPYIIDITASNDAAYVPNGRYKPKKTKSEVFFQKSSKIVIL